MESEKCSHCEVCGGLHGIHRRAIPRSHKSIVVDLNAESKGLLNRVDGDSTSNTHSKNFHSVTWCGRTYTFNKNQAIAIKLLWEATEKDEGIHQHTIGESLDTISNTYRLLDTFRQHGKEHPAWSEMINRLGHGVYALKKHR